MKKTPFIHTFLFGIFPVLFLYAHNIKKIPIDVLFRPLTVAFVFGKNGEKLYHYKNFNRIDGSMFTQFF